MRHEAHVDDVMSYAQDYFLPLALEERWPDDVLFLVFEEDFRFEPPPAPATTPQPRGSVARELPAATTAGRSLSPPAVAEQQATDRRLTQADKHVFVGESSICV